MDLKVFEQKIFSQNGEDGILEAIFNLLNINTGTFFEFGAADGVWLCNTRRLLLKGWKGLYVEPDLANYQRLLNNTSNTSVICRNQYVESSGPLTIENHWTSAAVQLNVSGLDFLSIDVDGFDDELFESIKTLRPKVIMVEVNAGHNPMYSKRVEREISANNVGQSMYIMTQIAAEKGYMPVCYCGNLIFVHELYVEPLMQYVLPLDELYRDFWLHLNTSERQHLKKTFLDTDGLYNNFKFDIDYMKQMWTLTGCS
jgi:hypothetical protein